MSRISIEVSSEEHQRLKACAALAGKSLKDYILDKVLPPVPEISELSEDQALASLEAFINKRVESAKNNEVTDKTVMEIFDEVKRA